MEQLTPQEAHNQRLIIGLTTALLALCWILYLLRLVSRRVCRTPLWVDDWFMAFCLFVCTGMSILNYVGVRYGSGVHRSHLTSEQYHNFQINLYVFMMMWALGVAVVKIGILIFYWRIFAIRSFRRDVLILGAIILCASTAIFLTFMFQCTPIPRFWNTTKPGYCINQVAFYLSGGSLNIAGDVAVLSLPVRQVWNLKASKQQKLALLFLFLLGGFVCITSIFRLIALKEIDPEDFAYTNVGGGLWSTVEVQVGFICANLPHTRPLVLRLFKGVTTGTERSGGASTTDRVRSHGTSSNDRHGMLNSINGFQKIDDSRHGPVDDLSDEFKGSEGGSYGSEYELSPVSKSSHGIAVHTHMRQEVVNSDQDKGWQKSQISTNIASG